MFLTVKEAVDISGKSQTTIHRLCQKYEKTKNIRKENNKYLVDKDFLQDKYPNDVSETSTIDLINPATGENLLKSLTEKNLQITDLSVKNKDLEEMIEGKNTEIVKIKAELLENHHDLAEMTEANLNIQKEVEAMKSMVAAVSEESETPDIETDKKLIRYQIAGITISVMVLAAFIFALYYLTK